MNNEKPGSRGYAIDSTIMQREGGKLLGLFNAQMAKGACPSW